jgi:dTMP kinase
MEVEGLFVTFEGIDGSGKSTQSSATFECLCRNLGEDRIIRTFEPGGWEGGGSIRSVILSGAMKSTWTEVLLFLADRSEHVERVIRPSLLSGKVVICERFSDSTIAYQVFGKGFPRDVLDGISSFASFPEPDITFWLDIPVRVAMERINSRHTDPDRFESDHELLERIATGYAVLSRCEPDRIKRLDGMAPAEDLTETIVSVIMKRIEEKTDPS